MQLCRLMPVTCERVEGVLKIKQHVHRFELPTCVKCDLAGAASVIQRSYITQRSFNVTCSSPSGGSGCGAQRSGGTSGLFCFFFLFRFLNHRVLNSYNTSLSAEQPSVSITLHKVGCILSCHGDLAFYADWVNRIQIALHYSAIVITGCVHVPVKPEN